MKTTLLIIAMIIAVGLTMRSPARRTQTNARTEAKAKLQTGTSLADYSDFWCPLDAQCQDNGSSSWCVSYNEDATECTQCQYAEGYNFDSDCHDYAYGAEDYDYYDEEEWYGYDEEDWYGYDNSTNWDEYDYDGYYDDYDYDYDYYNDTSYWGNDTNYWDDCDDDSYGYNEYEQINDYCYYEVATWDEECWAAGDPYWSGDWWCQCEYIENC